MSLESTLTDLAPYRYVNADHVEIARPRLVKGGELLVQLRQTLFELEGTLSETTKYLGEDLAHYIPLMEPLRSTNPADLSTRNNTKQHMHVILALDTFMQAFDQMIAANRRQREEREQQVKRAERARQLSEKRKRGSVEEDEDEEDEEM